MPNILLVLFFCTAYAVLNVTGAAIIKKELLVFQLTELKDYLFFLFRPKVIVGFSIILISALTMFKALSLQSFSYVIPLATGINFTLTIVIGIFFFRDKIGGMQLFGLALILFGIMVMSLAKKSGV